jgi:hypothetical protein
MVDNRLSVARIVARAIGLRKLVVAYRHSALTNTDVMIASYPKSGNTWLRALISSALGFNPASFEDLSAVVPELEMLRKVENCFKLPNGGRLVKTHESWNKCYKKGIYVVRDPTEVAMSYFNHHVRKGEFHGGVEQFLNRFLEDRIDGYGSWANNVRTWLEAHQRNPDAYLIIGYRHLVDHTKTALGSALKFLDVEVDDLTLVRAVSSNTRNSMREKEMLSSFRRNIKVDIPFVSLEPENNLRTDTADLNIESLLEKIRLSTQDIVFSLRRLGISI